MKAAFFIIMILIFNSPAHAFTLITNGISRGWNETTLSLDVNESSCTALGITTTTLYAAIDAAIDLWNSAPTSNLKLARGSVVTTTASTNPPTIYCSNAAQSDTTAGVGSVSTSGGVPVLGSLYLNGDSTKAAFFNKLTSTQQQIVVSHEIGHVLGLGHSEKTYAMMYYNISTKTNLNLSQDDIDGLTWLNPSDELKSGLMGCATIQDINSLPPGGGNFGLLLNWAMVLMIAFAASRRRNGLGVFHG